MKILFFGDSITDMGRKHDSDGHIFSYGNGYVYLIASKLFTEVPGTYEIINRGISGNRIVDLYARIKSDVWNQTPDVLSILIGVNDVWHDFAENPNGVEIERWEKIYRALIEETKERLPNTRIILCEPFVLHGTATDYEDKYEKFTQVFEYAKVARKIAADYGLEFVSLQEEFDKKAAQYGAEYFLFDGVHPHVAGATLIADEWLKVFKNFEG